MGILLNAGFMNQFRNVSSSGGRSWDRFGLDLVNGLVWSRSMVTRVYGNWRGTGEMMVR